MPCRFTRNQDHDGGNDSGSSDSLSQQESADLDVVKEIWPSLIPIWPLSEEMISFVRRKPTPTLYFVPQNAVISRHDVVFENQVTINRIDAFLGSFEDIPVLAFMRRSMEINELCDLLKIADVSKKVKTFSSGIHFNQLCGLLDWVELGSESWLPGEKGTFEIPKSYRFNERIIKEEFVKKQLEKPSPS